MSLFKLAQSVELTMDVPESDKKVASNLVSNLKKLIRKMDSFNDHLSLMHDPFKKYQSVSTESIEENRSAIWNYRKQILKNFDELKDLASVCVNQLEFFKFDTTTKELISGFIKDFSDIESAVDDLEKIIEDYGSEQYKESLVKAFDNLKKENAEFKRLVTERVMDHLVTNVLNENWVDKLNNKQKIDETFKKNVPLITNLFEERDSSI